VADLRENCDRSSLVRVRARAAHQVHLDLIDYWASSSASTVICYFCQHIILVFWRCFSFNTAYKCIHPIFLVTCSDVL
jgi:hypothetical protein